MYVQEKKPNSTELNITTFAEPSRAKSLGRNVWPKFGETGLQPTSSVYVSGTM